MTSTSPAVAIAPENNYFTTINIFRTTPAHQEELTQVLLRGMHLLDRQSGFVATSLHRSHDGERVVAYVQWESREAFEAMRSRPDAQGHFESVGHLVSSVDAVACQVTFSHDRPEPSLRSDHAESPEEPSCAQ